MSRRSIYVLVLGTFVLGAIIGGVVGILGFLQLIGGSGEPSVTISAPTLSLEDSNSQATPGPDTAKMATGVAQIASQVAALSTVSSENASLGTRVAGIEVQMRTLVALEASRQPNTSIVQAATRTALPTATPRPTQTPTPTQTQTPTALPNQRLFRIVPEQSEVRFILDELVPPRQGLVGSTNQVAGDIIVDLDRPANSRVGTIRINLRSLRTDDARRDQAIRGEILLSAQPQYEFADFVPVEITGLPDRVTIGEPLSFQVTGDFALRGVTRSLTFDVTATLVSEVQLQGSGTTTIQRADYGLLQGFLADRGVSDEIRLEIEFVAREVKV